MGMERDEVRLIVETAELRIFASVARIEARLDAFQVLMEERDREYRAEMARMRAEMAEFRAEVRADIKSLRRTTVVTGISAVLAIFFGVSAVNSALLGHFKDGVDAGTRAAVEHEAVRREMRELVARIESRLPEPAVAPKK